MKWFSKLSKLLTKDSTIDDHKKLKAIIREAVEEFCKENNLTLEEFSEKTETQDRLVPITTFKVTVKFIGKVLKKSISLSIKIKPDLISKKPVISVVREGIAEVNIRTNQRASKLKKEIKRVIFYEIESDLDRFHENDEFLDLLNKIKSIAGSDVSISYNSSYISLVFGNDKITIWLTYDSKQKELKIERIRVNLSTEIKTVLFVDTLVNHYDYKEIIEDADIEEYKVDLYLLQKSKNEQLEILSKVIELVKMYNLFS